MAKKRIPWNKGKTGLYKHSEEAKEKIRKARARQVISEETKRKLSAAGKGRIFTDKTRRKLSKANKGKIFSEEHRRKIREARAKQIFTKETRKKMSESTKGHKHSKETRKKIGESQKGKIISEETREKIRKGQGWKKISEESKQKQKARTPRGKKHPRYGKTHTEEVRKILRESRLHQVFPVKDNKFELAVQSKLRKNKIEFETHKPILGQPDLFIEPNICVFLDGDFHHANPARYSDDRIIWKERISRSGIHRPAVTAKMIRLKDKQVRRKLRSQGYKITAFWWSEWKKDPDKCIKKILKAIKA